MIPEIKHTQEETTLDTKAFNSNNEEMFEYGEDQNYIPTENDGGYEGAIVLKPNPVFI